MIRSTERTYRLERRETADGLPGRQAPCKPPVTANHQGAGGSVRETSAMGGAQSELPGLGWCAMIGAPDSRQGRQGACAVSRRSRRNCFPVATPVQRRAQNVVHHQTGEGAPNTTSIARERNHTPPTAMMPAHVFHNVIPTQPPEGNELLQRHCNSSLYKPVRRKVKCNGT